MVASLSKILSYELQHINLTCLPLQGGDVVDTEEVPLAVRPAEGVDAIAVEVEEVSKKKKKKKRSADEAAASTIPEAAAEPMDIGECNCKSDLISSTRVCAIFWLSKKVLKAALNKLA